MREVPIRLTPLEAGMMQAALRQFVYRTFPKWPRACWALYGKLKLPPQDPYEPDEDAEIL